MYIDHKTYIDEKGENKPTVGLIITEKSLNLKQMVNAGIILEKYCRIVLTCSPVLLWASDFGSFWSQQVYKIVVLFIWLSTVTIAQWDMEEPLNTLACEFSSSASYTLCTLQYSACILQLSVLESFDTRITITELQKLATPSPQETVHFSISL